MLEHAVHRFRPSLHILGLIGPLTSVSYLLLHPLQVQRFQHGFTEGEILDYRYSLYTGHRQQQRYDYARPVLPTLAMHKHAAVVQACSYSSDDTGYMLFALFEDDD